MAQRGLLVFPVRIKAETLLELDAISAEESRLRQEKSGDPRDRVTRGELARVALEEYVAKYLKKRR